MRNLLLFSVLLLGTSWMAAQTTTTGQAASGQSSGYGQTQSNQGAAGNQKTVTGCLSQANGQYMLTTKKGNTYQLNGDSSELANHVGHEIKVTGTESSAGASGTANGATANGPTIDVTSMKHISKTCKTAGDMGGMSH
jgi:Protein of unknown function (DUF5818)